ncbi:MAG: hypothetical protein J6I76_02330 [Oribacterium sp.]|nr:hypothetical protein [Oribacterium sp.]
MQNTVIYGTGTYGKRVLDCLKIKKVAVSMFLVTEKTNEESIEGIPVYGLSDIDIKVFTDTSVIVAVDECHHEDIKNAVIDKFDKNILEHFYFYKKNDIDKLFRDTHPFDMRDFLLSVEPVSRLYGYERGTPVDRLYIERFLKKQSSRIKKAEYILEVGEDTYSKKYFPNSKHDILDYSKGMDLTKEETLTQNMYDVFVCTQVFHQIYDVKSAIKGAYYLLKHGGIMLATVCGNISKLARNEEYEHYWGFTRLSIGLLIKEVFGDDVEIESYGNIAIANAFIQGIPVEEIKLNLFDIKDEDFTICISIAATKK